MAELAPLSDVIARHQLFTRKSLGQHFLLDAHLMEKIVAVAGDLAGVHVIEIGPGPGGLTRALLATGAASVTAVEKDERCLGALEELRAVFGQRLNLVSADALETDIVALAAAPRAVVANLPYNVGTELLLQWLLRIHDDPGAFRSLTLMFQKEVAERLLAKPRSKAYGRLSVFTQWLCEVEDGFDIPPGAFLPPPKVTSTVVRLTPRARPLSPAPRKAMEQVLAAAFNQRRKMLRASLKSLNPAPEPFLLEAGVPPTARAEELSVEQFAQLARLFGNEAEQR